MRRLARRWPSSASQGRGSRVVHTLMKLHLSLPVWKENIIDSANNVNIGSRLHSVWAAVSAPTRLTNWRDCKLDVSSKYDCALFLRMIAGLVLGFPSVETKRQVGKKNKQRMVMCLALRDYFDVWWCVFLTHTVVASCQAESFPVQAQEHKALFRPNQALQGLAAVSCGCVSLYGLFVICNFVNFNLNANSENCDKMHLKSVLRTTTEQPKRSCYVALLLSCWLFVRFNRLLMNT